MSNYKFCNSNWNNGNIKIIYLKGLVRFNKYNCIWKKQTFSRKSCMVIL